MQQSLPHPIPEHLLARESATDWSAVAGLQEAALSQAADDVDRLIGDEEEPRLSREERAAQAMASLAFEPVDPLRQRLMSKIVSAQMTDTALARDIAYFGETNLDQIMEAYGLDGEELLEKLEEQAFKELVHKYRVDMQKDVNGMIRARAAMYLDAQLEHLHRIVTDSMEKSADRIRAHNLMAELADAKPRNTGIVEGSNGGGVALTFNFGTHHPQAEQLKAVIAGDSRRVTDGGD